MKNTQNTRLTLMLAVSLTAVTSSFLFTQSLSAASHQHGSEEDHQHNSKVKLEQDSLKNHNDHKMHKDDDDHEEKNNHDENAKDDNHSNSDKHDKDDKDDNHGDKDGHEEEKTSDVELSKDQIKKAGIETIQVKKQSLSSKISALSEVKLNQYKTINVSPPISTRIEKRHVRLGDYVQKGQLLVTLHTITSPDVKASVSADKLTRADINASLATTLAEMEANIAQAKGEVESANATWNRLNSLGKDAVAGKRLTAAKIARNQASSKLQAYQRSRAKIKQLGNPKVSPPSFVQEHYELHAEQSGMVIMDDFVIGQIVNPEYVLLIISDMNHLWVEANIKPEDASIIDIGAKALIKSNNRNLKGKVISIGRLIDEKTRTLSVRIQLNTEDVRLYPGQFVKTQIESHSLREAISIPTEAVLRSSDGDWMVFIEEIKGRFVPKEVEILENLENIVVIEGLEAGTTIVSKGAFFVQSEFAKSGFSVHNH